MMLLFSRRYANLDWISHGTANVVALAGMTVVAVVLRVNTTVLAAPLAIVVTDTIEEIFLVIPADDIGTHIVTAVLRAIVPLVAPLEVPAETDVVAPLLAIPTIVALIVIVAAPATDALPLVTADAIGMLTKTRFVRALDQRLMILVVVALMILVAAIPATLVLAALPLRILDTLHVTVVMIVTIVTEQLVATLTSVTNVIVAPLQGINHHIHPRILTIAGITALLGILGDANGMTSTISI
jgi:hypothetical protein